MSFSFSLRPFLRPFIPITQTFQHFWQQCNERERILLSLMSIFLGFSVVYLTLWQPAKEGIEKLERRLPQQHNTLLAVQTLAAQIKTYRSTGSPPTIDAETLKQHLLNTLNQFQLKPSSLDIKKNSTHYGIDIHLEMVYFSHWLQWLEQIQNNQILTIENISIDASNSPGIVSLKATLFTAPSTASF